MRRKAALIFFPVALGAVFAPTAAFAAPGTQSSTIMSAAAEVPGPGDYNGGGLALVTPKPAQGEVCINIKYRGIEPPTGAHIHEGPPGVAGPIVVDFTPFIATSPPGEIRGCAATTPELASAIATSPNDYYANVHDAMFPSGAIRGQLHD